jgi:thiol-disulfide isomerase/thioredoxin
LTADKRVPAPPLRGMTLGDTPYDVASDLGHVVVVNFWGSWCEPCRAEQPKLNAVFAATRSRGVRFIGIDVREDSDDAARAFVRTHGVSYPSIIDRNDQLALDFSPRLPDSPPTTVVLDRQGRVAARIIGSAPSGVLEPLVDQLLGESGTST